MPRNIIFTCISFRAIQHKSPLYIWFLHFILSYRIRLSWKVSLEKGWPLWKTTEVASLSFRPHGDHSVLLGRCRCSSASPGRWKSFQVSMSGLFGPPWVETLHHHHWLRLQATNNFHVHSVELDENAVWVVDTAGACTTTVIRGQRHPHPFTLFRVICQSCCKGYSSTAESDGFYIHIQILLQSLIPLQQICHLPLTFLPWRVSSRWTPLNALVENQNQESQKAVPRTERMQLTCWRLWRKNSSAISEKKIEMA